MKKPFCFYGHTDADTDRAFLSNFYPAPAFADLDGCIIPTPTSEHAFMLYKAYHFGDRAAISKIMDAETPAKAKALGRKVNGFNDLEWNEVKFDYMVSAVKSKSCGLSFDRLKFYVDLSREYYFVETSPYDKIWGVGVNTDTYLATPVEERDSLGQNLLGKALDKVFGGINELFI